MSESEKIASYIHFGALLFDNKLIFFFSALGAFNSIVLSIYFLFFLKPVRRSNIFLGLLLAALSIRVWKSLFFYFNPNLSKIYLQIGLSACFFIGPFLYFYLISKRPEKKERNRSIMIQLIILLGIVLTIGIIYPYQHHVSLWYTFYTYINLQWLAYILLSAYIMKPVFRKIISRDQGLNYEDTWSISIFLGVFIIWLAYYTASYTSYISGALSFTFVFYLSGLLLFKKRKKEYVVSLKKEKYADSKIEEQAANDLVEKITDIMTEEELYKNSNLSLSILAKKLHIRPQLLSQILNNNLNKSFSQFINEYRIQAAKQLLTAHPDLKIEAIAEKCGYNSKSTFYTAFKKITNTTPAKYLQENKSF